MIYQISYELRNPDRDYSEFFVFLEQNLGLNAIHVLRDVWWIATKAQEDIDDLTNRIIDSGYLGKSDSFFIVEISSVDINGWMPGNTWKWYKTHKG